MTEIDTTLWERSSNENWASPTPTSLKMLKNLSLDYIVSDTEYANYTISSTVTNLVSDDDGFGVVFDYLDSLNYKYIMYQGGGLNSILGAYSVSLFSIENGIKKTLSSSNKVPYWKNNTSILIKLENIFDDIVFYVGDIEVIRYKKNNSLSGKIGFVTYSQICDFNDIKIHRSTANRMKAKYTLYAVESNETFVEIEVARKQTNSIETEISPRVIDEIVIDTEIFSIYRGISDVYTEIQPIGYSNIEIEIEVPPNNRMWANYEVQQPPIVTEVFNPIQDAFTRENAVYQSINYGSSLSMVVGKSPDDIWRSFVQFDLSWFNPSYKLTDAKLRLYYTGSAPQTLKFELFNADNKWSEYGITHLNRPSPIELITSDFTVNTDDKYIEFNTLKIVENWIQKKQVNNGFIIRVANESNGGIATFKTRESMSPPELIVNYYDSKIFSFGRSQILTEINSMRKGQSDHNTEIEVGSVYSFNKIETEIYAHRKEVPLIEEVLLEITSTVPYVHSEIEVAIPVDEDIFSSIDARSLPQFSRNEVDLNVSRPFILTEIYSSNTEEIKSEINVIAYGESALFSDISVSRDIVLLDITAQLSGECVIDTCISANKDLIYTEIRVVNKDENEVQTEIDINDIKITKILAEILVSHDRIYTEVSSRVSGKNTLYTEILVTRNKIVTEVSIPYRSDILVEITPNIKSDVKTEIISSHPSTWVDIIPRVLSENTVSSEVFVPYKSMVLTDIIAHITNNIDTVIDIISINKVNSEITATKPSVWTDIVIPTWIDLDIHTTIEPRILMVDNIHTVIQIGSVGGAYAFII